MCEQQSCVFAASCRAASCRAASCVNLPLVSLPVNLLDFNDANDSIILSIDGVLSGFTCIKSNASILSSVMVDLIADKVLFNLENNLSGSAVITGNVVIIFSNI